MHFESVVEIGITRKGRPFIVYGVSDRSEASRRGNARICTYGEVKKIRIEPEDESAGEQKEKADHFYNVIITDGIFKYALAGNGRHTDVIYPVIDILHPEEKIKKALHWFDAEDDEHRTPRIAGLVDGRRDHGYLGIVTAGRNVRVKSVYLSMYPGKKYSVSTCTGKSERPEAPEIKSHRNFFRISEPCCENASDLAESLYKSMDKELRVLAAAACLVRDLWDVSVFPE